KGAAVLLAKTPEERSGILSSARTFLALYRDPIIAENTRKHDFCIRDLVYGDKPLSLYLCIPAADIERVTPIIRLMLTQVVHRLTSEDYNFRAHQEDTEELKQKHQQ